jgi:hypothetical protein
MRDPGSYAAAYTVFATGEAPDEVANLFLEFLT